MSQSNPAQISQFCILKILFNIILPFTSSSSKRFLFIMFPNQILDCILFSPMHATCLANTSVLDLILLEICGQECTVHFSNFLFTSSLLSPNIFFSILFTSNNSRCERQISNIYTETAKLDFYIFAFLHFQITERKTADKFQKVFYSSQCLRSVEGNLIYHDISKEGSPFISRDDRENINDWRWRSCYISKRRDILI